MAKKPNGGPALTANGENVRGTPFPGSLRDWFAGMALQPLMEEKAAQVLREQNHEMDWAGDGNFSMDDVEIPDSICVADMAYVLADAMIAEREKGT